MQKEFMPVVEALENECRAYFADRIVSASLHGSIAKRDAIPFVSDLDYHIILSYAHELQDLQWIEETTRKLETEYPQVNEIHLTVITIEALRNDPFTRFILEQNALLRMGKRMESIPEFDDCEHYIPDGQLAKMRLPFARQCFKEALEGRQPACTGEIPENECFGVRKLARYFVVIEGAYFLMAKNRYRGFEKESVLAGLKNVIPAQYISFLHTASVVLEDPFQARISQQGFIKRAKSFVEWMFSEIENT